MSLLEYRWGKIKKRINLKRLARRHQIRRPFSLSTQEIKVRLEAGENQLAYFREHRYCYRKKHLFRQMEVARKAGKHDAARQIPNLIEREKQKAFWGRLKRSCGKKKGGSPTLVQVEGPMDTILEYET